jgi:integrase/recombinase XerC
MAKPFRITIIRYLDADGRRVPKGTLGAKKVKEKSANYYGRVPDGRGGSEKVPLCPDHAMAKKMLTKILSDDAGRALGIGQFEPAAKKLLVDHLADYQSHLTQKGNTPDHTADTVRKVRRLFTACKFVYPGDLDVVQVGTWLVGLRQEGDTVEVPDRETFAPADVAALLGVSGAAIRGNVKRWNLAAEGNGKARKFPRATVLALAARMSQGASPATVNHYVRAVRGFARWMVKAKRLAANPLDGLELLNEQVDVRRARRELSADELRRLFDATRNSDRGFRGLSGIDRVYLYLTAATTGFRASALAALTPEDFRLADHPPVVVLAARFNKSRKPKNQPLPPSVAEALAAYLAGKPTSQPVWGGTWASDHRGAEMIRGDLEAAGIPYTVPGPDGDLHADFHALRHSYVTGLGRSGVDLRTAQLLAGHSKPELTARYSHRNLNDLSSAVNKLPSLVSTPPADPVPNIETTPPPGRSGLQYGCRPVVGTPVLYWRPLAMDEGNWGDNQTGLQTTKPLDSQGLSEDSSVKPSEVEERGRRDSNPQPPDRQSGTLTN